MIDKDGDIDSLSDRHVAAEPVSLAKLRWLAMLGLFGLALVGAWSLFLAGQFDARTALATLQTQPVVAPLIFMLALVITTTLLMPLGLGLNLGAGILWGALLGGLWTTLASVLAAVVGFLLARVFGEHYLKAHLESPQNRSFLETVQRNDWKIIFLVRLNPVVPFGLQNYLFGITGIPLSRFVLLSLASCAIPSFLYATIGASLSDLVLTGELRNLLRIGGVVLLLVTIGYLTRLYFRKESRPS